MRRTLAKRVAKLVIPTRDGRNARAVQRRYLGEGREKTQRGIFPLHLDLPVQKLRKRLNPRDCVFSRKASLSHPDCKRCVETLLHCQIGLPISLGKFPRFLLVTRQPEWGCDKNNARDGSRKVWVVPIYLCCGKTRKEICRMTPLEKNRWCSSRLHIALTTGLVLRMQYCWIITVTLLLLTS